MEELQQQIDKNTEQIKRLEKGTIQLVTDPTTALYLEKIINDQVAAVLPSYVAAAVATLPTQTYSAGSPVGSAPTGSLWMEDTGVLATRKIHVYSGSAWIQMK